MEGTQLLSMPFIQVWDVKWPRGLRMLLPGPKDAARVTFGTAGMNLLGELGPGKTSLPAVYLLQTSGVCLLADSLEENTKLLDGSTSVSMHIKNMSGFPFGW